MTYICTASLMSCNILSWLLAHGSLSLLHFSVYYWKRVMLCLAVFSHTPVSSSLSAYRCLLFNSIFLKNLVGGCDEQERWTMVLVTLLCLRCILTSCSIRLTGGMYLCIFIFTVLCSIPYFLASPMKAFETFSSTEFS